MMLAVKQWKQAVLRELIIQSYTEKQDCHNISTIFLVLALWKIFQDCLD